VKPGATGLKRLYDAAGFSARGLAACWRSEAAFRQETAAAAVLIPAALYLGAGGLERAVLVASVLLVLVVELVSASVEAVVDRLGDEPHPLAARAKDVGSAAVMLSLSQVGIVWALVLLG